jgi:hypothetical protein
MVWMTKTAVGLFASPADEWRCLQEMDELGFRDKGLRVGNTDATYHQFV